MGNAASHRGIQWRRSSVDVQDLAARLCERDSFFSTPHDSRRAQEVLDGEIFYRERLIKTSDWAAPSNVEDSLQSSWKFYYHALVWLAPLRRQYLSEPDDAYRIAYLDGVRAWLTENGTPPVPLPTQQDPGDYTWYDMSTAWRTMVVIGAVSVVGEDEFYLGHLAVHAAVLADEGYYAGIGNHALHQNYALLSAAMVLDRDDYLRLALDRIQALRAISIDDEGVALEGSASYHLFNLYWWSNMDRLLLLTAEFIEGTPDLRVPDMRPFLRYAVAPDGKIVPLGDSTMSKGSYRGVVTEYPADFIEHIDDDPYLLYTLTQGARGEPSLETMRIFEDGYWFSRSTTSGRKPENQSHVSMRFGAGLAERVHAHDDAGSVTFYPRGTRVLEDGGLFGYYGGEKREFVKSNRAHNTVVVEGRKYYRSAVSPLESVDSGLDFDQAHVRVTAVEQCRWSRIVAHARDEDFLFIQDHLLTNEARARQIFNLGDGFEVVSVSAGRVDAENDQGEKVSLLWLDEGTRTGFARGRTDPLLGWRSTFEGELHPVCCVTADHDGLPAGEIRKAAVVVLLLADSESFADVRISEVHYGTNRTQFTLERAGYRALCNVVFNVDGARSTLIRLNA